MNFQNIRNEFVVQCKEREQAIKDSQQRAKFEEELAKQYQSHSIASRFATMFSCFTHCTMPDIVK